MKSSKISPDHGYHYHLAVNLPNNGQISNLPGGAIVETPAVVTGAGVHGENIGMLPEAIAELCRRELEVVRLSVDAAVNGDRLAAMQCLLLDPVITDIDVAERYTRRLPAQLIGNTCLNSGNEYPNTCNSFLVNFNSVTIHQSGQIP